MIIDIVTIFPKMFSPVLGESIIKRAQAKGLVKINVHDLRDYASGAHKKVDDAAYGAGGMLFKPEPMFSAVEAILGCQVYPDKLKDKTKRIILLSPKGKKLDQKKAKQLLGYQHLILLAPRYEGVDARVEEYLADEEISIGDYVLSGAELASMVLIDSLVRLIPGVVSDRESIKKESFENNLLDHPHYTRPPEFRGLKVPQVLLSGDHKAIKDWRQKKALELTKKKRPDLLKMPKMPKLRNA
jgi:tRNA (guanine37-N1)-methyltransferase